MNKTPATNTERAGRRSDAETSWRQSGTNEGRTRKESIAKRDHGEEEKGDSPVFMCFDFFPDLSNESVNFAFLWWISGVIPEFSESIFSSDKLSYGFRKAEVWCVNYPGRRGS
ncbi:hypothetical protein TNCV_2214841 [Trichonephila clavipes]|nr:hypothetical protein TNCV_2214841 [Trichonephila clavipes]